MMEKSLKTNNMDLCGKRFGRLVVMCLTGQSKNRSRIWQCKCDCGNVVEATTRDLNRGAVKSCGCLKHRIPQPYHSIKSNLHFVDGTCIENLISSQKRPVKSRTGVRGVYLSPDKEHYIATIGFQGKSHYLGRYDTLNEAKAARQLAEQQYFETFLRENILPVSGKKANRAVQKEKV